MFWWLVVLMLLLGWLAGLDLVGLGVMALAFIVLVLGTIAGLDRHRRRPEHFHPQHPYQHLS
jgi:hypothetical protein